MYTTRRRDEVSPIRIQIDDDDIYTAKTKPMIGRTFYGHAQFMYKYKNWAKRRYGIYLADFWKIILQGNSIEERNLLK